MNHRRVLQCFRQFLSLDTADGRLSERFRKWPLIQGLRVTKYSQRHLQLPIWNLQSSIWHWAGVRSSSSISQLIPQPPLAFCPVFEEPEGYAVRPKMSTCSRPESAQQPSTNSVTITGFPLTCTWAHLGQNIDGKRSPACRKSECSCHYTEMIQAEKRTRLSMSVGILCIADMFEFCNNGTRR